MANLSYVFIARDSSTTPPGKPVTGLTPSWVFLKTLASGTSITPTPTITEIGYGQYKVVFDPEANGDSSGQIDLGSTLANPSDRYVDLIFFTSDSRTNVNLDAAMSTRSTFAGGPVASVAAPVAVGSVAAGALSASSFAPSAINATVFDQSAADRAWSTVSRTLTGFNFNVGPTGPVTVGGYAPKMDPASQILANPAQPLATDASGRVTVGSNQDKLGYQLSSAGLDAITVETGVNARQALSPILASAAGVLLGAGTGTITIRGANTSVTRIVATTDNFGNRSAITMTLPT